MAKLELPDDKELAGLLVDIQARRVDRQLQVGWIGIIIGPREQAPFNIAATIGVIALLALVLLLAFGEASARGQAVPVLASIVSGVLGYIFGKHR
jgi:hypothetical protein